MPPDDQRKRTPAPATSRGSRQLIAPNAEPIAQDDHTGIATGDSVTGREAGRQSLTPAPAGLLPQSRLS